MIEVSLCLRVSVVRVRKPRIKLSLTTATKPQRHRVTETTRKINPGKIEKKLKVPLCLRVSVVWFVFN